jgi:hypothetical protein
MAVDDPPGAILAAEDGGHPQSQRRPLACTAKLGQELLKFDDVG